MAFDYTNLLEDATSANNGDFIFTNRAGTLDVNVVTGVTNGEWSEEVSSTGSNGTGPESPNNTTPPGSATGFVYTETSTPSASTTWACQRAVSFDSSTQDIFLDLTYMVAVDTGSNMLVEYATIASPNETTDWTILETIPGTGAATAWIEDTFDFSGVGGSTTFWIRIRFDSLNDFTNDLCISTWREYSVDSAGITSVDSSGYGALSDEFDFDDTNVDINGQNFLATRGTGDVYISDASTLAGSVNEVDIDGAVDTWSDIEVGLDFSNLTQTELDNLHTLGPSASRWIIVTNNDSDEYSLPITLHRPKAIGLKLSGNITASGENTTAVMTAPATKSTGSFGGGRIQDDENPGDTVDIGVDEYREDEWSIEALLGAVDGETYQFRVLLDGSVADTITVIPELTISDVVVPNITNAGDELFELNETNIVMTGTDFGATETGSAKVELVNNVVYASGTKVSQSVDTWSATSIQFDLVIGALTEIDLWLYVTDSVGTVSSGYAVQVYRTPTITNIEDEIFSASETSIVLDGTYLQSPQGTGKLEISDNAVYATGTKVLQTINTWTASQINFDLEIGSVGQETMWMWVTNDLGRRSSSTAVTITGLPISDGLWKAQSFQGTITALGFNTTIFLIRDE